MRLIDPILGNNHALTRLRSVTHTQYLDFGLKVETRMS